MYEQAAKLDWVPRRLILVLAASRAFPLPLSWLRHV
jgi:hypothetical protein